jgi:hypothetical protein
MNDVHALLTFITRNPSLFPELNKKALNCAHEVLTDRNVLAHQEPIDVAWLINTATILLREIDAGAAAAVERLRAPAVAAGAGTTVQTFEHDWPEVTVVACAKRKRKVQARAEDLYDPSLLFRLCRDCVRNDRRPWLIVSSQYGFVEPHVELKPYEEDINRWPKARRERWIRYLTDQAQQLVATHRIRRVIMLAGQQYRQAIAQAFGANGISCLGHPQWTSICRQAFGDEPTSTGWMD